MEPFRSSLQDASSDNEAHAMPLRIRPTLMLVVSTQRGVEHSQRVSEFVSRNHEILVFHIVHRLTARTPHRTVESGRIMHDRSRSRLLAFPQFVIHVKRPQSGLESERSRLLFSKRAGAGLALLIGGS